MMYNDDESNFDPTDFFLHRGGTHVDEELSSGVNSKQMPLFNDSYIRHIGNLRDLVNIPFTLVGDDQLFKDLYDYHQGSGFMCITFRKVFYLIIAFYTITLPTFIMTCVDWKGLQERKKNDLYDALYPMCKPESGRNGFVTFAFSVFIIWWIITAVRTYYYLKRMKIIRDLWIGKLELSNDVQWVTWQMVIDSYHEHADPTVDSHYIVNRIMRWDNYLIAMLTKNIFGWDSWSEVFTKILEWNLEKSIGTALFRNDGILKKDIMLYSKKNEYVYKLKRSFIMYGILNIICMPFVFSALTVYFISRYASEYYKNPKAIGVYSFTPLAKWKLRDFNELEHVYNGRLNKAHPKIIEYLGQFVNEIHNIIFKFMSFILGATLLTLLGVSFINTDIIISLFVTEKPIIYWVTVVGIIFAAVQNTTVDEPVVFEPEEKFDELMRNLHGTPTSWNNMSTKDRYYEIRKLFRYKWMVLLCEIISVIYVPFILLLWLPRRAERIVNFFRENSIHVDKMGIICSCAKFDAHQPLMNTNDVDSEDDVCSVTSSMERKMSTSVLNFKQTYKTWDPDRFRRSGTTSNVINQEYEEKLRLLRLQREQRERSELISRETVAHYDKIAANVPTSALSSQLADSQSTFETAYTHQTFGNNTANCSYAGCSAHSLGIGSSDKAKYDLNANFIIDKMSSQKDTDEEDMFDRKANEANEGDIGNIETQQDEQIRKQVIPTSSISGTTETDLMDSGSVPFDMNLPFQIHLND